MLCIFLAWGALRSSVVSALARDNPFVATAVAPGDPRGTFGLAMIEFMLRNGRVSPPAERRALSALSGSMLADEPFLLAAITATARGDAARGEALLAEARRRNPRNRMVRLLLLDRYLRTGRADEAGVELTVLARLIPGAGGALTPQLAQLARDSKTRSGLARMLRRDPGIRDAVLVNLVESGVDPDGILSLAEQSGAPLSASGASAWQSALLKKLISRGDLERAYSIWRGAAGLPVEAGPPQKAVYDGTFRGAVGPAPFNWELIAGAEGVAERSSAPALQVQYYGRSYLTLATQLLLLRPGNYRLQFRAEGSAKGEGTHLAWTLSCAGSTTPFAKLPLRGIDSAPRMLALNFNVPTGCRGQWLRLEGFPGDVAAEQDVVLSALTVAGL